MSIRLVVALAASAAIAPMAGAQTVSDPDPYHGIPQVGIAAAQGAGAMHAPRAVPPHAGMSHAGSVRGSHWGTSGPSRSHVGRPSHARPGHAPIAREIRREIRRGGVHGGTIHGGAIHGGRFSHVRRIGRGAFVPQFWWGPQFVVHNWGMYGFPQPFSGGRWIRYYDDAYLIDRSGRVHDSRYGYDWDRHQDRWSYDRNGIPVYVGDGDFEPGRWDYEWAERCEREGCGDTYAEGYERSEEYADGYAEAYDGPPPGHGGGYGYGAAYGYGGYCACGPVVVTETTVTTPAVVEQVTYYETVTERVRHAPRAAPRAKKVKVRRIPVAPAHLGEKG